MEPRSLKLQVFVSGTWKAEKALPFKEEALFLGQKLARSGVDVACGPGTGIARHIIDGYRSIQERGKIRYYLPLSSEMEAVGEAVEEGADEIIETDFDYPIRNVFQIKQCQGLIVLTGGDGTLEEILPAVIDYQMPVAILEDAGSAARALRALLQIYPEWSELILFSNSVEAVVDEWLRRVLDKDS